MTDKVLNKIKKLLALAKSNNPHEAGVALSRAQKLMEEHSISQSDLALTDCEMLNFLLPKQKLNKYEAVLLNVIENAFGVQVVVGYAYDKKANLVAQVNVLGIRPQPELAVYCLDVTYRQLVKARKDYVSALSNNCKKLTKIRRGDDFAMGWIYQVSNSVRAFALTEEKLALIQTYMDSKFSKLTSSTAKSRSQEKGKNKANENDIHNGMQSAKNVRLDRPVHGAETRKLTGATL